jgi:tetratricopeptide (TPR) repeat protein
MTPQPLLEEPAREILRLACRVLDAAEHSGSAMAISQALASVAHAYSALSEHAFAENCLDEALRLGSAAPSMDWRAELLCLLCETAVQVAAMREEADPGSGHAARERARDHAFEASQLAARVADREWEVKLLLRVSDALNRLGDHDDATGLQTRALRLINGSRSLDVAELPGLGRLADT